jgi:hypothetical protein
MKWLKEHPIEQQFTALTELLYTQGHPVMASRRLIAARSK